MKLRVILPEKFWKSASACGFEYCPEQKHEVKTFLDNLQGLQYYEEWGCVILQNGELIPVDESLQPTNNGPFELLVMEWSFDV